MDERRKVMIKYICIHDDVAMIATTCTISEATDLLNLIKTTSVVHIKDAGEEYDKDFNVLWTTFAPAKDAQHLDVVDIVLEPDEL